MAYLSKQAISHVNQRQITLNAQFTYKIIDNIDLTKEEPVFISTTADSGG